MAKNEPQPKDEDISIQLPTVATEEEHELWQGSDGEPAPTKNERIPEGWPSLWK